MPRGLPKVEILIHSAASRQLLSARPCAASETIERNHIKSSLASWRRCQYIDHSKGSEANGKSRIARSSDHCERKAARHNRHQIRLPQHVRNEQPVRDIDCNPAGHTLAGKHVVYETEISTTSRL